MNHLLKDAFTFPVRGGGLSMLIIGGVLGVISELASLAPIIGLLAIILLLGFMISTYFQIIQTTATGSDEAPEFPETSSIVEDFLYPILQVIVVGLISLLPLIVVSLTIGRVGDFLEMILIFAGIAYFPMAMMAVAVLGELRAASPLLVLPSIFRAGTYYWLAVGTLIVLYFLEVMIMEFFSGIFIVATVVAAFLGMYTLMANGRILGLIYREKKEELDWL